MAAHARSIVSYIVDVVTSENQIKENQVHLCGKRMSAHQLHANQMRLNFSIAAQMLANDIRRIAFKRHRAWKRHL